MNEIDASNVVVPSVYRRTSDHQKDAVGLRNYGYQTASFDVTDRPVPVLRHTSTQLHRLWLEVLLQMFALYSADSFKFIYKRKELEIVLNMQQFSSKC